MAYDENGYETGYGYETVGDELGAPLAALRPGLSRAFAPGAQQATVQNRGLSPAAIQAMRNPQMIQQQMANAQPFATVPQVRNIVRQELSQLSPFGAIPPKPNAGEAMFPLGLGIVTFTSATPTSLTLIATPQRAFRGERLILEISKNGPGVQTSLVVLSDFKVGDISQKIGGGVLPAAVFAADAFGVRLMLDGAVPGVQISLTFDIGSAPAVGESIQVSGAIIGRATETQG